MLTIDSIMLSVNIVLFLRYRVHPNGGIAQLMAHEEGAEDERAAMMVW